MKMKMKTEKITSYPSIGVFLPLIGWLLITAGIFAAVYLFVMKGHADFIIGLSCAISGIVVGVILIGIGKIIDLLVTLVNNEYTIIQEDENTNVEESL